MDLLPNETILLNFSNETLILTTHRIRKQTKTFGGAKLQSIMLEELSSCALTKTSQPLLIVLAILFFLSGSFFASTTPNNGEGFFIAGLVIALFIVLAYFLSQQQVIAFASVGTTIIVKEMKLQDAKDFINRTERAKNNRYLLMVK